MKKLFVLLIAFFAMCAFAGAAVTNLGTLTLHEFDGNTGGEMLKITNSVGGYGQIFAKNYTPTFCWSKNTSGSDPEKFNKITLAYAGGNITATILNAENPPQSDYITIPFPGVDPYSPLYMKITLTVNGDKHYIDVRNFKLNSGSLSFGIPPVDPFIAPPSGNQTCQLTQMFNQLDFEISLGAENTADDIVTIDFSQETEGTLGEGPIVWFDPCKVIQDDDPLHPLLGAVQRWDNQGTLNTINPLIRPEIRLFDASAPNYCMRPIEDGCFDIVCGEGGASHHGLWFKESPCYGMSSLLEFPANDSILSDWTSVLTPQVGHASQLTKNLLVVFKPTGELDEDGLLYDDDIQTIFEAGGAISGFNVYIDKGYLFMGIWNRVQRYAFKYEIPLERGEIYLAHLEMQHEAAVYDENKYEVIPAHYRVRMIVNGIQSEWFCFKGLQHDDSPGAIGGESHGTTYNRNLGVFDDYARWFTGCIGDVLLYANKSEDVPLDAVYYDLSRKYQLDPYIEYPPQDPIGKASDWKVFDNSPIEGNSGSTFEVYPNPFSNSATLDIRLAEAQNVRVELFDMAGQKVMTVFDGACTKGLNSFPISGTSLLSGVYAVRISGNGFVNMAKVVLTK